jgi:hypothetical protein
MTDHYTSENSDSNGNTLTPIMTAATITLTPEMFEKLYFSPQSQVKGDLRKTFANPTPVLAPFLIVLHAVSD